MTSSTQRSVCGARLRLSWRGFRPRDRCLWPADSHLGGQRSYAWGGSVHISPRDDVGRVDPLRTYCTLTWRRSETLLSTRQQTAFASPANLSPKYTETSPLVASDRFLQRDAACTWRRSYSAHSVHNLRGPERVRGQGARTCWVQAIVASDRVRALVLSGARRPPPACSQVADLGGPGQSFRRSVKRSRARSTRLPGPTTARGRACHLVGARAGAYSAGSPLRRGAPGCLDGLPSCALPQAAGAG